MKNPLTPAGIEPATYGFVAQHLNHCATVVPKGDKDRLKMKEWGEISNLSFNALATNRWKSAALVCLSVRKQQIEKLNQSSWNLILELLNKSTNHFSFSKTNYKILSTVSWSYLHSNWLNIYRRKMFRTDLVQNNDANVCKGSCKAE